MATRQRKKTKYNAKELAVFDALIDEKLSKAKEQLEYYRSQIAELGDNEDSKFKSLGESTTSLDVERLYDLASRQSKLIQHLENAKRRIQNKVYGICRATGKLISKERLMAVPHATLSIEAKQGK